MINNVHYLRGLASLTIVFHHWVASAIHYDLISDKFVKVIPATKFGVDFFFVLSGFIIAYSNYRKSLKLKPYLLKRLTRVYVPYLPIGLLALFIYTQFGFLSNGKQDIDYITSIFLLPRGRPALSVAWSLSFEIYFYIIFGFSMRMTERNRNRAISLYSILIVVLSLGRTTIFIFDPYVLEFFIGMMVFHIQWGNKRFALQYLLVAGILSFIFMDYNIIASIAFSFILIKAVRYDDRIIFIKPLFFLGTISYSLYLIHNPLVALVNRMIPLIFDIHPALICLILVALSCCLAYYYYYIFEKRLTNYLYERFITCWRIRN